MRKNNLIIMLLVFTSISCGSLDKGGSIAPSFQEFLKLELGNITDKDIQSLYGASDKVYYLKDNKVVEESDEVQWVYKQKDVGRLYLLFNSGVLVFKNWTFGKEGRVEKEIDSFVKSNSNWKIIKEPMSNPHRAPNDCYLENLKLGKRVKFNAQEKRVDEISIWKPSPSDKSIKLSLAKNVGKKFCITGNCSKVTDPGAWKHDQCVWLRKYIK